VEKSNILEYVLGGGTVAAVVGFLMKRLDKRLNDKEKKRDPHQYIIKTFIKVDTVITDILNNTSATMMIVASTSNGGGIPVIGIPLKFNILISRSITYNYIHKVIDGSRVDIGTMKFYKGIESGYVKIEDPRDSRILGYLFKKYKLKYLEIHFLSNRKEYFIFTMIGTSSDECKTDEQRQTERIIVDKSIHKLKEILNY